MPLLSDISKNILGEIAKINNSPLTHFATNNLVKHFYDNYNHSPFITKINSIPLDKLRREFLYLDRELNEISTSKFQDQIMQMEHICSYQISGITVHTLAFNESSIPMIIAQALHIFTKIIDYDYSKLVIYAALDTNIRTLDTDFNASYAERVKDLKMGSKGLNVSGYTNRYENKIVLTKAEDIIKLLYHELSHYTELDSVLNKSNFNVNWSLKNKNMNLSETYSETLSVLFNAAFISIQDAKNIEDAVQNYNYIITLEKRNSVYLTGNILKFYGFNYKNVHTFFDGTASLIECPIAIWEYVFLRTQLLFNMDYMLYLVPDYRVTSNNYQKITELCSVLPNTIKEIINSMKKTKLNINIPYTVIQINYR
jgi:hypothetical protein